MTQTSPETESATAYAERLAVALWEKHFKDDAPQWKPLSGDLAGIISQIDNMTCGLTRGLAQRSREQVIEECANHLERKADMLTNSLHCGDNSATIAAAHKKSRQLYEAAAIISELALAPSDSSTTRESK